MLRRVPPDEACGGAMGLSPWGSTLNFPLIQIHQMARDLKEVQIISKVELLNFGEI